MKILLIEDEPELRKTVKQFLHNEGHVVESASDFRKAEDKAGSHDYDCVLVDITLPGGNGLEIIRQLKKNRSKAGVIIISAKNSLDDKVAGLELGADDYLTKPFHLSELNARIKSVNRRMNFEGSNEIIFAEITVNTDAQSVKVKTKNVDLTKKEYDLLLFFMSNRNRVITKESIAEHLWGDDMDMADSYDFIYSHIKNLRKKIMAEGGGDYIHTVYGAGYKFGEE
ncbi:MAG TPA: response regulator transcription factor [Bacteroidia bacterium]|jgi:DNA-binding response OmpR family regulator|nr:response regulator transcription factor [Bacteroidia bacterium]